MRQLDGRVAIVTGAAGGIGREIALCLAEAGADLVVSDINLVGVEETAELVAAKGRRVEALRTDVSSETEVEAMVALALSRFKRLDIGVNNAGIEGPFIPIHEISLDDWNRNVHINLTGTFLCMKHELLHMRATKRGAIVNISSAGAIKSGSNIGDYAATKRGILSLTSCAAVEAGEDGVRVNAVLPGAIATAMLDKVTPELLKEYPAPLGAPGTTRNVADAVLWLVSDAANYVTGQYIAVDGGVTA